MDKEKACHNVALSASRAFVDSNMPEYINSEDGYKSLVSDLTSKYVEAYNQAEQEISKPKKKNGNKATMFYN